MFSSRTLSAGSVVVIGPGIGVGVVELSGRKIVLNPLPTHSPTNAARGPRGGAGGAGGWTCSLPEGKMGGTAPNSNPAGVEMVEFAFATSTGGIAFTKSGMTFSGFPGSGWLASGGRWERFRHGSGYRRALKVLSALASKIVTDVAKSFQPPANDGHRWAAFVWLWLHRK